MNQYSHVDNLNLTSQKQRTDSMNSTEDTVNNHEDEMDEVSSSDGASSDSSSLPRDAHEVPEEATDSTDEEHENDTGSAADREDVGLDSNSVTSSQWKEDGESVSSKWKQEINHEKANQATTDKEPSPRASNNDPIGTEIKHIAKQKKRKAETQNDVDSTPADIELDSEGEQIQNQPKESKQQKKKRKTEKDGNLRADIELDCASEEENRPSCVHAMSVQTAPEKAYGFKRDTSMHSDGSIPLYTTDLPNHALESSCDDIIDENGSQLTNGDQLSSPPAVTQNKVANGTPKTTRITAKKKAGNTPPSRYFMQEGEGRGCFNCGKQGHYALQCPEINNTLRNCYVCASSRHFGKDCPNSFCLKCGLKGHRVNECGGNDVNVAKKTLLSYNSLGLQREKFKGHSVLQDIFSIRGKDFDCSTPFSEASLATCLKCGKKGHTHCGDIHLDSRQPTIDNLYCSNCGRAGHHSTICHMPRGHVSFTHARVGMVCFKCGESGHKSAHCPENNRCHYCMKVGHKRRECPSKVASMKGVPSFTLDSKGLKQKVDKINEGTDQRQKRKKRKRLNAKVKAAKSIANGNAKTKSRKQN